MVIDKTKVTIAELYDMYQKAIIEEDMEVLDAILDIISDFDRHYSVTICAQIRRESILRSTEDVANSI